MSGECRESFFHTNAAVQALRRAVPIYNGDWSIVVRSIPRKTFPEDFLTFICNCIALRANTRAGRGTPFRLDEISPRTPHPTEWDVQHFCKAMNSQSAPVDILWAATNFGAFLWDWNRLTIREEPAKDPERFGGVYGKDIAGTEFLPRVFLDVPPRTTLQEIPELCEFALAALAKLPDLARGLPRARMQHLIRRDMANLGDICIHAGTFGRGVLPGADDPFLSAIPRVYNGNDKEVFAETSTYFYQFKCTTS